MRGWEGKIGGWEGKGGIFFVETIRKISFSALRLCAMQITPPEDFPILLVDLLVRDCRTMAPLRGTNSFIDALFRKAS